jgi:hypothetical protein
LDHGGKAAMTWSLCDHHPGGARMTSSRSEDHSGFATTMTPRQILNHFEISKMNRLRIYRSNCKELRKAEQNLAEYIQREKSRIKQLEDDAINSAVIVKFQQEHKDSKKNDSDNVLESTALFVENFSPGEFGLQDYNDTFIAIDYNITKLIYEQIEKERLKERIDEKPWGLMADYKVEFMDFYRRKLALQENSSYNENRLISQTVIDIDEYEAGKRIYRELQQ